MPISATADLELSDKQKHYLRHAHAPINLAYGAARSGKNFIEAARLAVYLAFEPRGFRKTPFIFGGASTKAIKRIVLNDLFDLIGPENYKYKENDGSGTIYGREFYSFGAAKANSHEPMRGLTAGGAMITELTLAHKNFWDELQLRLSVDGAMLFADTNPGPPNHWVKTDVLDNPELKKALDPRAQKLYPKAESQLHDWHFLMTDNPSVIKNQAYLDKLLAMYPPGTIMFKRMIEGLWAMAEGRVWDTYGEHNLIDAADLPTEYDQMLVGVDYGMQNSCVFLLIGVKDGVYYVIREYYYSGRIIGVQQTNSQYLRDFQEFLGPDGAHAVFADPSAAAFILELARAGYPMEQADNSVLPGLQYLTGMFSTLNIRVCRQGCPNLHNEILSYCWDPVAILRGEEKPLKVDDHGPDALRYAIYTHQNQPSTQDVWDEMERMLRNGHAA